MGVSDWLLVPPIVENGFELTKQQIWDSIRLPYGWSIAYLATTCACGSTFTMQHSPRRCNRFDSKTLIRGISWFAGWTYITLNWKTYGTTKCCWHQQRKTRYSSKRMLDSGTASTFRCKGIWPKRILKLVLKSTLYNQQKGKRGNCNQRNMQVEQGKDLVEQALWYLLFMV